MKPQEFEQHDNHIWMTVNGEGWAIQSIERYSNRTYMHFWRGYAPLLQHLDVVITDPDWPGYCERAVEMLEAEYGG